MSAVLHHDAPAVPAVLHLPHGIPGFPDLRELATAPWGGEDSPFVVLSAEEPCVRFVAVSPWIFFPEYRPSIPADVLADLELTTEASGLVMVLLTLGAVPADTTANLLGPVVINRATGAMRQVVLSGSAWSPRTPIARAG